MITNSNFRAEDVVYHNHCSNRISSVLIATLFIAVKINILQMTLCLLKLKNSLLRYFQFEHRS